MRASQTLFFYFAAKIQKISDIPPPPPPSKKGLTNCCLFQRTQIRGMCDASNQIWKNQQVWRFQNLFNTKIIFLKCVQFIFKS
jgi:hypothetical protein